MLKQLSQLERTRNILILGFVALMAVSLVLFFRPGGGAARVDPSKSTEVLAVVGGEKITVGDFTTEKQRELARYSQYGITSLARLGLTDEKLLDRLIVQQIMVQEAERLGLGASESEVKERIAKLFRDPSGKFLLVDTAGKFDMAKYQERVGDIPSFERGVAADIAREKLEAFVTTGVTVSEDDVRNAYKRKNTSFDLTYISVSTSKLAEKIQTTDQELKDYYEKHKTEYRIDVPQKKVRYIFIDQAKAGAKAQISEQELRQEFENVKPEFKVAGVKVQQIVLRVAREDLDADVMKKANDLVTKARGQSETTTEEAFAELAKGNSEDAATAKNGGRVAGLVKKSTSNPDDPFQKTLDMQPGEVTDPIKYKNAYYILRRGDSVPKTFEMAKPELLVSARNNRGYRLAQGIAQKVQDRLKATKDPQKVAQEFAPQANMNPADMVRETAYIKPGDDVPNVGVNQQFEQAIESLNNPNDVGQATGIKNGFAIPMLVDKKEPRIPDFDEVKSKIADAMKQQRAKDQLEQKAKDLLASVNSPDALKAAGEKEGYDAGLEESFKLNSSLGKAGTSAALDDLIYGLKQGELAKAPIKVGDNWVVVGVVKRNEPDFTAFNAGEQVRLKQQLLRDRENQVFEDYIATVQQRMKKDGKITIYDKVLDQLDESEAAAEPGLPQGLNFPTK